MAHGQPDFGMYQLAKTIYRLADMGELAVRLGSIVTYDRRGDVIFMDDFEGGEMKWVDPTAYVVVSTDYAFTGSFSCKLTPPAAIGGDRFIGRSIFPGVLGKYGLETTLLLHSDVDMPRIQIGHLVDGVAHFYVVRYRIAAKTLEYQTGLDAWTEFADGLELFKADPCWHKFKLVADLATNKFARLLIDEHTYDISSYDPYVGTTAIQNAISVLIGGERAAAVTGSMYVDNAIVTQNEP